MKNKNMTTIYVVRHGESESNLHKDKPREFHRQWGETEAPLTEKGEEQAKERAKSLAHVHFDAVFSSDLTRAKQTAEFITLEKKLAIQTSKLIRERSYGDFVDAFPGKNSQEIREEMKKELSALDDQGKMKYKYNSSLESAEDAAIRLLTFLREIAVAYAGKTVLITNHGNNMRSMLTHLGWATYDELTDSSSIENPGYVILESDGVDFFIKDTYGIHKNENGIRTW